MDEPETMELPLGVTPDLAQVLMAVGSLVQVSASAEMTLRSLYCALIGSKYATVTAAGQGSAWLITECRNLLEAHTELTVEQRGECTSLLTEMAAAYQDRNRIVHDVVGHERDSSLTLLRSQRGKIEWQSSQLSLERVEAATSRMRAASSGLTFWIHPALGTEAAGADAQLRWEAYMKTQTEQEIAAMLARRGALPPGPDEA